MSGVDLMLSSVRRLRTDLQTEMGASNDDARNDDGLRNRYGLPVPDPAAIAPSPDTIRRRQRAEALAEWASNVPGSIEEPIEVDAVPPAVYEQRRAAKEPMRRRALIDLVDEERPDLEQYFNEFGEGGLSIEERIKICRSYASYLASLLPPRPKAVKRARK